MKVGNQADTFGKFMMSEMRDKAIDFYDGLAVGKWKSPRTRSLQTALSKLSKKELAVIRRCVIASVDCGVHDFLFKLSEANDLEKGIAVIVDGENVAEQSDGLHGELFGEEGWYATYSKHGDFKDPA